VVHDRGLLDIAPDADLGRFLASGGKRNGKPDLRAPRTLGELLKRNQAEHPIGVAVGDRGSMWPSASQLTRERAGQRSCDPE